MAHQRILRASSCQLPIDAHVPGYCCSQAVPRFDSSPRSGTKRGALLTVEIEEFCYGPGKRLGILRVVRELFSRKVV